MFTEIKGIEYVLPDRIEKNDPNSKSTQKIGIYKRHIVSENEIASDLALRAANKLFNEHCINPEEVEFLIYCTQSPDYLLPTTACILQHKLKIPTTAGAFDFNLGCSGYVYGLSIAKGLIQSGQVQNVLLLTSETYSKYINSKDKSVKPLFGDAASATFLTKGGKEGIRDFLFGTDGSGAKDLMVPVGGMKKRHSEGIELEDEFGNVRSDLNLYMNGPSIFNFTLVEVPLSLNSFLKKTNTTLDDYDKVIFHQANLYMLKHLQKKLNIPDSKMVYELEDIGNTVSSTIPIALKRSLDKGILKQNDSVLLVGFGVGLSWGICNVII